MNILLKELLEDNTITLYHATRKPSLISKNGIKVSEAGVIRKEGIKRVYASDKPLKAIQALQYEDDLKQRMGIPVNKGDIFVVQFTVPFVDVIKKPNGDFVIDRDVKTEELDKIITKNGKDFQIFKK